MRIEPFGDQLIIHIEKKPEPEESVPESDGVPFRMFLCRGVIEAMPTVPQVAFEDRGGSDPFNDRIDNPLMQSLLSYMRSLMTLMTGLNQAVPVSDLSVGDRVLFHGGIELDVVDEPCLLLVRSSAVVARLHSEEEDR